MFSQLSFLNQKNGKNYCRNDFMIVLHKNYMAKLGFEHVTTGSWVGLEFNGPVKTIKVVPSRSVYLTTL